jgi:squalene-associated FAD-dependent desaturase
MKSVIVIGGGLSGLAAAVACSSSGFSVTLLEQHRHMGGRAYSFIDQASGDVIDNGQHLMLGCYLNTFKYLNTIGSYHKLKIQPDLSIQFRHPKKGTSSLDCPRFPAPFHLLAGLTRLKSISTKDRVRILRVIPDIIFRNPGRNRELDSLTVDEWLNRRGQSESMKEYLWNLITIATLNDSPIALSARPFTEILREVFFKKRAYSSIVLSKVGLSELFVDDAIRFLQDRGVKIIYGMEINSIDFRDGWIGGIRSRSGEYFGADAIVSAIPYYALKKILHNSAIKEQKLAVMDALDQFTSSPILSIHLWFDRAVMEERFAGLLGTHVHWVFNKSALSGKPTAKGQYLTLVISGAREYVELQKDVLISLAIEELKSVFPETIAARLLNAIVIKERRATFSARCGIERHRPSARTEVPNFFLAGDWTATGLPATIEGAIKSGFEAARVVTG